jgi:hypothetical protein
MEAPVAFHIARNLGDRIEQSDRHGRVRSRALLIWLNAGDQEIKEAALRACDHGWVWPADTSVMPALPLASL